MPGSGHGLGGSLGSQLGSDLRRLLGDGELAAAEPEARPGVTLQGDVSSDSSAHRFHSIRPHVKIICPDPESVLHRGAKVGSGSWWPPTSTSAARQPGNTEVKLN